MKGDLIILRNVKFGKETALILFWGNAQLCGCVSCDNAQHQTYYKFQLIVAVNIKAELSQILDPLFYNKDRSLQI